MKPQARPINTIEAATKAQKKACAAISSCFFAVMLLVEKVAKLRYRVNVYVII